jgi:SAM-dependent methyltransferase
MDNSRRTTWEARWANPEFALAWAGRGIPAEVVEAIRSGWLPASRWVLDAGCGTGERIAWFRQQGCKSYGIDIAPSAIAMARTRRERGTNASRTRHERGTNAARARHERGTSVARTRRERGTNAARTRHERGHDGPQFQAIDICDQAPPRGPFDIIVDRRFLHGIPSSLTAHYASNCAAVRHDRTRLLVFMWIGSGPAWWKRLPFMERLERLLHYRRVARVFRGSFTIEEVRFTDLRGIADTGEMPGTIDYLRRRPSAVHGGTPASTGTST